MDSLAHLREAAQKAREYDHEHGPCTYRIRIPTRPEVRAAVRAEKLDADDGGIVLAILQGVLLRHAIVGWTGVRACHVAPVEDQSPLTWSPEAVALWIDANPDAADKLGAALLAKLNQRSDLLEVEAKN
jgi:hypothetical protein